MAKRRSVSRLATFEVVTTPSAPSETQGLLLLPIVRVNLSSSARLRGSDLLVLVDTVSGSVLSNVADGESQPVGSLSCLLRASRCELEILRLRRLSPGTQESTRGTLGLDAVTVARAIERLMAREAISIDATQSDAVVSWSPALNKLAACAGSRLTCHTECFHCPSYRIVRRQYSLPRIMELVSLVFGRRVTSLRMLYEPHEVLSLTPDDALLRSLVTGRDSRVPRAAITPRSTVVKAPSAEVSDGAFVGMGNEHWESWVENAHKHYTALGARSSLVLFCGKDDFRRRISDPAND